MHFITCYNECLKIFYLSTKTSLFSLYFYHFWWWLRMEANCKCYNNEWCILQTWWCVFCTRGLCTSIQYGYWWWWLCALKQNGYYCSQSIGGVTPSDNIRCIEVCCLEFETKISCFFYNHLFIWVMFPTTSIMELSNINVFSFWWFPISTNVYF